MNEDNKTNQLPKSRVPDYPIFNITGKKIFKIIIKRKVENVV